MKNVTTFRNTLLGTSIVLLTALGGPALAGETAHDEDITPLRDVQPAFPDSALRRMVDGYVVVRFDVNESGRTQNIRIVESSPERTFDGAVATAIRRSLFDVSNEVTDVERVYRFDARSRFDGVDGRNEVGMFNAFHQ